MSEDYYGDLVAGYTKAEVAATPAFRITDKRGTDMPDTAYVPDDYEGDVIVCSRCGNPAPRRDTFITSAPEECTPCFIGRVSNEVATLNEAKLLKAEIEKWEKN